MATAASRDEVLVKTLPDHARCDTHKGYRLNCAQYEQLLVRSGHVCEICRNPNAVCSRGKLHIDHLGHKWAVRGLLCTGCNSRLRQENRFSAAAGRYLDNAWWEQQCAQRGLPKSPGSEPPVGSAIRNQWGLIWIHQGRYWEAPRQNGQHPTGRPWKELFWSYGAHNLVPYDLRAAFQDGSIPFEIRYALRESSSWAGVRHYLGLPDPEPKSRIKPHGPRDSLPWLQTPERTAQALRAIFTPAECLRVSQLLAEDPGVDNDLAASA